MSSAGRKMGLTGHFLHKQLVAKEMRLPAKANISHFKIFPKKKRCFVRREIHSDPLERYNMMWQGNSKRAVCLQGMYPSAI